jgi:hypothetical protein
MHFLEVALEVSDDRQNTGEDGGGSGGVGSGGPASR